MFGILANRFRVLLGKVEQRSKVVRDIVLTFAVLYNMLRAHQEGVARVPTQADEVAVIQNEPVVHVADENSRNHFRDANQQRDLCLVPRRLWLITFACSIADCNLNYNYISLLFMCSD